MKAIAFTFILLLPFTEIYSQNSSIVPQESVSNPQITGDAGTWSSGANIPSPGSNGGAGISYTRNDTNFIYCINGDIDGAGYSDKKFRAYNVNTNTWTDLPNYLQGRAWVSGALIGTNVYAIGGIAPGCWTEPTATIQKYNIINNKWTMAASMIYGTGSSGACGYQDSLMYVIGGMGATSQPIMHVQLYNQTSNTWRLATPLPQARANGWMWIKSDTIYYGCGAGPTTSTFNNNIFVGVISQTNRANITWTTSPVTYPGANRHRMDAAAFGPFGIIIGPGAGNVWWGTGNECYTWKGGNSQFVANPTLPIMTSDAMVGSGSFIRGNWKIWKFVVASGLIMQAPYHILNTQIYTDSIPLVGINGNNTSLPKDYSLFQNYPNPFNPTTTIKFDIPPSPQGEGLGVRVIIYDILGREITTLVNEKLQPGSYEVSWDAANYPSGVYFYQLITNEYIEAKKMILIK